MSNILKDYQQLHTEDLAVKLSKNGVCFDASDTGVGKTYSAIATALKLNKTIFLVCPRNIVSFWKSIISMFGVELICISTYHLIIKGKSIDNKGKSIDCPYMRIEKSANVRYKWDIPDNTLVIFDEVHKCSNYGSYISEVFLSLKNVYNNNINILLISATICENPAKFRLFSVFLKWFDSYYSVPNWLEKTYNPKSASDIIMKNLISKCLISKIKISDLGDDFQKNQVIAEYYDINKNILTKIDALHTKIKNSLLKIDNKIDNDKQQKKTNGFISSMRERQQIEILKIPIFVDLVAEYLENNFSVVVFVNFVETLEILSKELKINCICYGEISNKLKEKNISDFLEDRSRVIICTIGTCGESISLNDKYGRFKRVSLINPQWSSIKLIQACGRNSRIDSVSQSLNVIVYANTPMEKLMCNKIKDKCSLYNQLTDADLSYDE
jgi:superfamily II DNA or RNA helicase